MRYTVALAALALAACTANDGTPATTTSAEQAEQEILRLNCDRYEEFPYMAEAFWTTYDEAEQTEQLARLEEACPGITATLEAARP